MNYIYESFDGGKTIFRREGQSVMNHSKPILTQPSAVLPINNGNHNIYESPDGGNTILIKKKLDNEKTIIQPILRKEDKEYLDWGIWDEV